MNYWSQYQGQDLTQKINAFLCLHSGVRPGVGEAPFLKAAKEIATLPREMLTYQTLEDFNEDVFYKLEPLVKKITKVEKFILEFAPMNSKSEANMLDVVLALSWGVSLILLHDNISCHVATNKL